MHIRLARPEDLAAVTALEAVCVPAAEAATEESFRSRLAHYASHFWLLEDGDTLVSFVNGLALVAAVCGGVAVVTGKKAHERA